ncbi:hypothetical protein QBE52_12560 [Clostridiaceae bacterium 35-E11]
MNKNLENNFSYMLGQMFLNEEQIKEFNAFMKEYAGKSDRYIFREIARVKNEVSQEELQQHIANLDHLYNMKGFATEEVKSRIDTVKKILTSKSPAFSPRNIQQSAPKTQFFFGSSLLLWFLALVAIWRRPFFGYPGFW